MFAANLAVGQPLYAKVDGVVSPLGKVIAAHEIGPEKAHHRLHALSFW
jgi:hypothetical protein